MVLSDERNRLASTRPGEVGSEASAVRGRGAEEMDNQAEAAGRRERGEGVGHSKVVATILIAGLALGCASVRWSFQKAPAQRKAARTRASRGGVGGVRLRNAAPALLRGRGE